MCLFLSREISSRDYSPRGTATAAAGIIICLGERSWGYRERTFVCCFFFYFSFQDFCICSWRSSMVSCSSPEVSEREEYPLFNYICCSQWLELDDSSRPRISKRDLTYRKLTSHTRPSHAMHTLYNCSFFFFFFFLFFFHLLLISKLLLLDPQHWERKFKDYKLEILYKNERKDDCGTLYLARIRESDQSHWEILFLSLSLSLSLALLLSTREGGLWVERTSISLVNL